MSAAEDGRPGTDLAGQRLGHGQVGTEPVLEVVVPVAPLPIHVAVAERQHRHDHRVGHVRELKERLAVGGERLALLPVHDGRALDQVAQVPQAQPGVHLPLVVEPRVADHGVVVGGQVGVVPVHAVHARQHLLVEPDREVLEALRRAHVVGDRPLRVPVASVPGEAQPLVLEGGEFGDVEPDAARVRVAEQTEALAPRRGAGHVQACTRVGEHGLVVLRALGEALAQHLHPRFDEREVLLARQAQALHLVEILEPSLVRVHVVVPSAPVHARAHPADRPPAGHVLAARPPPPPRGHGLGRCGLQAEHDLVPALEHARLGDEMHAHEQRLAVACQVEHRRVVVEHPVAVRVGEPRQPALAPAHPQVGEKRAADVDLVRFARIPHGPGAGGHEPGVVVTQPVAHRVHVAGLGLTHGDVERQPVDRRRAGRLHGQGHAHHAIVVIFRAHVGLECAGRPAGFADHARGFSAKASPPGAGHLRLRLPRGDLPGHGPGQQVAPLAAKRLPQPVGTVGVLAQHTFHHRAVHLHRGERRHDLVADAQRVVLPLEVLTHEALHHRVGRHALAAGERDGQLIRAVLEVGNGVDALGLELGEGELLLPQGRARLLVASHPSDDRRGSGDPLAHGHGADVDTHANLVVVRIVLELEVHGLLLLLPDGPQLLRPMHAPTEVTQVVNALAVDVGDADHGAMGSLGATVGGRHLDHLACPGLHGQRAVQFARRVPVPRISQMHLDLHGFVVRVAHGQADLRLLPLLVQAQHLHDRCVRVPSHDRHGRLVHVARVSRLPLRLGERALPVACHAHGPRQLQVVGRGAQAGQRDGDLDVPPPVGDLVLVRPLRDAPREIAGVLLVVRVDGPVVQRAPGVGDQVVERA